MAFLNSEPMTQSDERNLQAKAHAEHKISFLRKPVGQSTVFPGVRLEKTQALCEDCHEIFWIFNFVMNKSVTSRVPPTTHD